MLLDQLEYQAWAPLTILNPAESTRLYEFWAPQASRMTIRRYAFCSLSKSFLSLWQNVYLVVSSFLSRWEWSLRCLWRLCEDSSTADGLLLRRWRDSSLSSDLLCLEEESSLLTWLLLLLEGSSLSSGLLCLGGECSLVAWLLHQLKGPSRSLDLWCLGGESSLLTCLLLRLEGFSLSLDLLGESSL